MTKSALATGWLNVMTPVSAESHQHDAPSSRLEQPFKNLNQLLKQDLHLPSNQETRIKRIWSLARQFPPLDVINDALRSGPAGNVSIG